MHVVIRAGGTGTRLWPLSRVHRPKQFLPLISEKTLLEETIGRVRPIASPHAIAITTHERFAERARILAGDEIVIIEEPATKNTGPAMCLESIILASRWGEDAIVASIPSDDVIKNALAFASLMQLAEDYIAHNPGAIVTPAVLPETVDVGMSYLKTGERLAANGGEELFRVEDWVEKPSEDFCRKLIASGRYCMHTGMYVWRLKTILDLFKLHRPELFAVCFDVAAAYRNGDRERARTRYETISPESIETAVAREAKNLVMSTSNRLGWSDVGKWSLVHRLLAEASTDLVSRGEVVARDSSNSLIIAPPEKVIAVIGAEGMAVIDTPDALLIAPLSRVAEVKEMIEELKRRGLQRFI